MTKVLYANVHRNYDTSGTISLFLFGTEGDIIDISSAGGFSQSATIGADGTASVLIPQELAMLGTGINSDGLKITSEGDISAYVSNRRYASTDLSIVFEKATLGDSYVLASDGESIGDGGQFSVQATQDGTTFTFTLSDGQTASISLDAGQTFKFSTADTSGNSAIGISVSSGFDLTGTIIEANSPVAVFSGHACTNIGSGACDHIVEQMPAIDNLSTNYFVSEAFSSTGDGNNLIRVVAAEDDTAVSVDGVGVATLAKGDFYEFTLSVPGQSITLSKPALVAQYLQGANTAGEGDPAMSFVPGTETWLSSYVVATPSGADALAQNLVNLVVPTIAVSSVQVNGADADDTLFTEVVGTAFSVANIAIDPGVVRVEATENFQLSLFGFDYYDSFLTFGGASFASGASNVPPAAMDDSITTAENALATIAALGNDSDADGDILSITEVAGVAAVIDTPTALTSGALVTLRADGTIDYDPNGQFNALNAGETDTDSFAYSISDGNGGTSTATVHVTITGVGGAVVTCMAYTDAAEVIFGTTADNCIDARAGNDTVYALDGADTVYGGLGLDVLHGEGGADLLAGQQHHDVLTGGAGNDSLYGGTGHDSVHGEADNDLLYGNDGNDTITGDAGSDTIVGGEGRDMLTGGAGADVFGFELSSDSIWGWVDSVTDFQVGIDKIDLSALPVSGIEKIFGINSPDAVRVLTWEGDTYITHQQTNFELRLEGNLTAQISVDDFIF
jgi:VCBS repeat-containing protein